MLPPDAGPVIVELQRLLMQGSQWSETGDLPEVGFSCWGLVRYAYMLGGIVLPLSVAEAAPLFTVGEPRPYCPWDVLLMNFSGLAYGRRHVGVLLTPAQGFHCSRASNGVARFDVHHTSWRRSIQQVCRYRGFDAHYI